MDGKFAAHFLWTNILTASRRASARVAFHARAVPHQREVRALGTHVAFVASGFRFRAAVGLGRSGLRRSRA